MNQHIETRRVIRQHWKDNLWSIQTHRQVERTEVTSKRRQQTNGNMSHSKHTHLSLSHLWLIANDERRGLELWLSLLAIQHFPILRCRPTPMAPLVHPQPVKIDKTEYTLSLMYILRTACNHASRSVYHLVPSSRQFGFSLLVVFFPNFFPLL